MIGKTGVKTKLADGRLIQYGDVSRLKGKPWFMLDFHNEKCVEAVLRRLCKQVPGIFRDEAFEMFVVDARDDLSEL